MRVGEFCGSLVRRSQYVCSGWSVTPLKLLNETELAPEATTAPRLAILFPGTVRNEELGSGRVSHRLAMTRLPLPLSDAVTEVSSYVIAGVLKDCAQDS